MLSLSDPSYSCTFQIEADIYEPQGISLLDAEASFITNDLLGSALTKSFSGKKVVFSGLGGGQGRNPDTKGISVKPRAWLRRGEGNTHRHHFSLATQVRGEGAGGQR